MKLSEHENYDDMDDFESLLDLAEGEARSQYAKKFVASVQRNYSMYGENMFWSEKQEDLLRTIAFNLRLRP